MIRVVRGREVQPARWEYAVPGYGVSGVSRQPLSDACRQLIAQGVDPKTAVGRFREGRDQPDLTSTVGAAAHLTVSDPDGGRIHFVPFRPWPAAPERIEHESRIEEEKSV
jgi:hypothetical protein